MVVKFNKNRYKEYSSNVVSNLLRYSTETFNQFSVSTQFYFAEQALKAKKYYELLHIFQISEHAYEIIVSLVHHAIDALDKKAIEVITNFSKNSNNTYLSRGDYLPICFASDIINNDPLESKADLALRNDIFKLLINAKTNETLSAIDLQTLSFLTSKQEFEQFCQVKAVNITDTRYQNIDLSAYKYENATSVASFLEENYKQLIDILLNRTYSNSLSADTLKEIYNNIYALGPSAHEMLTYIATLIATGNPLKIIFEDGALSYYSAQQNIIKINAEFFDKETFFIESVVIHEMMHFLYNQALNSDSMPISFEGIKLIKQALSDRFGEDLFDNDLFDNDVELNLIKDLFQDVSKHVFSSDSQLMKLIETVIEHETAAVEPFKYLAKLIGANSINTNFTNYWAHHLKFNSDIDLFHIKSQNAKFQEILTNRTVISDDTYHSLQRIYENHVGVPKFLNKTYLFNVVENEVYPEVISQLKLSKAEIHFIERMADLINRINFFPHEEFSCSSRNGNELLVEFLPRSLELKAAIGNETAIINTFSLSDQYHNKHVSPSICVFLNENYKIASLPFSEQYLVGEISCLKVADIGE